MTGIVVAFIAGALIGLALGALGGGGSILAVPVLVYLLGQSPAQATTGSLVVVGVSAIVAAATAYRAGTAMLGRGVAFGAIAIAGAAVGASAAAHVSAPVLMTSFAALMLVIGVVMIVRQRRRRSGDTDGDVRVTAPIISFRPRPTCACMRALQVVVTATAVGLLTGFLGVGGGFLVVPALVVVLAVPIRYAAGTSLIVITVTSAAALAVRLTHPTAQPDWRLVLVLTLAAAVAALTGARLAKRLNATTLTTAFAVLVLGVAVYTGIQAAPGLL